MKKKDQISAEY